MSAARPLCLVVTLALTAFATGAARGETVIADPLSDLRLSLEPVPSAQAGSSVDYLFTVENLGPHDSASSELWLTLPAQGTLVSVRPSRGKCDRVVETPRWLGCTLGAVASGETVTVLLTWRAPAAPTILEVVGAVAATSSIDEELGNDEVHAATEVLEKSAKAADPPGPSAAADGGPTGGLGEGGCTIATQGASGSRVWPALLALSLVRQLRRNRRRAR